MTLSGGLCFPLAFRLIRHSLVDPSFSRWGIELSLQSAYCPTMGRPHRGLHVPHEEDTVGVGAFFTPGPSVFMPGQEGVPGPIMIQYRRADRISAILR